MRIILFISITILTSFSLFSQENPAFEEDSLQSKYIPGDHELFFMPTAYTMEQGNAYFSDYELILLNFNYALTSRTHVGIFSLFPITTDFLETVTVGAKQNYYRSKYFSAALWGSYTPKGQVYTLGNVFSIGKASASIHVGIALFKTPDLERSEILYLIGTKLAMSKKVSGIIEFSSSNSVIQSKTTGLITLGIRFHGETIAWDLGGVRPLTTESSGELLFLPFLKATYCF